MRTFSDKNGYYSLDMMFVYLKNNKYPVTKIRIQDYLSTLDYPGWGDPGKDISYSARDVIENPRKYPEDYRRILQADLGYPIIISDTGYIIDGVHRLSKAFLQNITEIPAYVFDKDLMMKFKLADKIEGVWQKINKMETYELIDLYQSRFCDKK